MEAGFVGVDNFVAVAMNLVLAGQGPDRREIRERSVGSSSDATQSQNRLEMERTEIRT